MKLLVYTRPRIRDFYHAFGQELVGSENCTFMSDHKGLEKVSIMDHFYDAFNKEVSAKKDNPHLSFEDYHSIHKRCRYLRQLNEEEATKCINAMWLAADRIINENNPDVIFGQVMDSYVTDIFDRVGRQYNKEYTGFLNNMINGYSRLTSRGELRKYRTVTDEEVLSAWSSLREKTYMPRMQRDFMWNISPFSMFFTKYLKERLKVAYYAVAKVIKNDPNNFYYNTVASQSCMSCQGLSYITPGKYADKAWQDKVSSAKNRGSKIIYFPLQFYPECSIDYWGTALEMTDFYTVTERLLDAASEQSMIMVKEHPSSMGLRNPAFYEMISKKKNVVLVPFTVFSNDVFDYSDVVITWTGSVGFEAAVRGIPLITFGHGYYDKDQSFYRINSLIELDSLTQIVENVLADKKYRFDESGQQSLVQNMLMGLMPGYVFPLDYKMERQRLERKELQRLAQSVWDVFSILGAYAQPLRPGSL